MRKRRTGSGWRRKRGERRRYEHRDAGKATKYAELPLFAKPDVGGSSYAMTFHLHKPESIIVPTLEMGKKVIKTLFNAFHLRILGLLFNFLLWT